MMISLVMPEPSARAHSPAPPRGGAARRPAIKKIAVLPVSPDAGRARRARLGLDGSEHGGTIGKPEHLTCDGEGEGGSGSESEGGGGSGRSRVKIRADI